MICLLLMLTKQLNAAAISDRRLITITTTTAAAAADDDDDDDERWSEAQLEAVLSSLEAAFRFMSDQAADLNLDAVIGTRMVEGTSQLLTHHSPVPFSHSYVGRRRFEFL